MKMSLRSQLTQMVSDLKAGIIKINSSLFENFDLYIDYLENDDPHMDDDDVKVKAELKANDLSVRSLGEALEQQSVKILSLQSPVSRDLRTVLSSFRMIYDLQRISRDCLNSFVDISSLNLDQENRYKQFKVFKESVVAAKKLLKIFEKVYSLKPSEIDFDYSETVEKSEKLDDTIDNMFEKHSKSIIEKANKGEIDVESAHKLLASIRSMERVGDHCCNLIERTIYILSGDKIEIK